MFCSNGDRSWLAALGPAGFQLEAISLVRVAGIELHGFFSSQSKGPLQFKTHAHVLIPDLVELFLGDVFGLALIGDETPVRDAIEFIGSGDDILLVDLVGPPSQCGHPVFDRPDRELLSLPVLHQGLDVLGLQGSGLHLAIAHAVQFVGDQRQHAFPVALRGVAALPAVSAELFQLVIKISHGSSLSVFFLFGECFSAPESLGSQVRLREYAHGTRLP